MQHILISKAEVTVGGGYREDPFKCLNEKWDNLNPQMTLLLKGLQPLTVKNLFKGRGLRLFFRRSAVSNVLPPFVTLMQLIKPIKNS